MKHLLIIALAFISIKASSQDTLIRSFNATVNFQSFTATPSGRFSGIIAVNDQTNRYRADSVKVNDLIFSSSGTLYAVDTISSFSMFSAAVIIRRISGPNVAPIGTGDIFRPTKNYGLFTFTPDNQNGISSQMQAIKMTGLVNRLDSIAYVIGQTSGGISDGDKVDIIVSSNGTVFTIDSFAVTGNKTNFSGISGDATRLVGSQSNGKADTVNVGNALTLTSGVLRADTSILATNSDIALKLNIADTSAMLAPYLRKADTLSLSNRINAKLNIADTSAMLAPYLRKIDTLSLSNRINTKLNASDTVKYVKYADTLTTIATKTNLSLYQPKLTLSTIGTEGAATLVNSVLNIPNYADTSIYNADGVLSGNRKAVVGSNTISFASNAADTTYTRIGNNSVTIRGGIGGAKNELNLTSTGIDVNTVSSNKYARADLYDGYVILRGDSAVLLSTEDIMISPNGVVKIRKSSTSNAATITGRTSLNEVTNVNIGNGLILSNGQLLVDTNTFKTINYTYFNSTGNDLTFDMTDSIINLAKVHAIVIQVQNGSSSHAIANFRIPGDDDLGKILAITAYDESSSYAVRLAGIRIGSDEPIQYEMTNFQSIILSAQKTADGNKWVVVSNTLLDVTTSAIRDTAVTTQKIATGAVTGVKTSFTGIAGNPTLLLGTQANGQTDTVRVGSGLQFNNGALEAITGGGGSVTQVNSGYGLTGGPITTSGTLAVDTTSIATNYDVSLKLNISDTSAMLSNYLRKTVDTLRFNTTYEGDPALGQIIWNTQSGTAHLGMAGGIDMPLGQGEAHLVRNTSGVNILKGKVVYISGASGNRPEISLADADIEIASSVTFGVTAQDINNGDVGFVFTSGYVGGLNTNSYLPGQALWLDVNAGGITNVKPTAPVNSVLVGYVITQSNGNGIIFVKIQNGYELDELHDVNTTGIVTGQVLKYNTSTKLWTPANDSIGLSNSTTSTQSGYFGDIFLYDDSTPSHYLGITNSANLTAARTLNLNVNDADRTVSLSGNLTVPSTASVSGTNTGDQTITLTGDVTGSGTGSFATTLATVTQANSGNFVKVTLDTKGRVTGNTAVTASDLNSTYGSQTANTFYAAPNGTAGNPSFRSIVAADIPTLNQNTTGTASNVTGTVAIANGGTGQTTQQAAMNALAGSVTTGQYLRGNGTNVSMSSLGAGDLTGTIPSGVLGNSSLFVGTTSIALNRSSANLGLTGISTIQLPGSTSGTVTLQPAASAGATTITLPATTGTVVTTGDNGTVTGAMINNLTITNDDISAGAGIATSKIATTTISGNLINLTNPNAVTFPRFNADNSVSTLSATDFRTAIGAGTGNGNGTVTSIATTDGITGGTITSTGTIGLTGQALALHNLSTNGLITRTGAGTVAGRTITGTANQISVTNGDGVSGNPTLSLAGAIQGVNVTSSGVSATLTSTSSYLQRYTGSLAGTFDYLLPNTNTLTVGRTFVFKNDSPSSTPVAIKTSSANTIANIPPGHSVSVVCLATAGGNDATEFDITYDGSEGSQIITSTTTDLLTLRRDISTNGSTMNQLFEFKNSAGNYSDYAAISARIVSNTSGSNTGALDFLTTSSAGAGVPSVRATIDEVGRFGIGVSTNLQRTLHVNGEARIMDLTTDNPTQLVGADADGDLSGVTLGNGLAFDGTTIKKQEAMVIACSDETTNLTTGTAKVTFRAPFAMTITGLRANVNTAPTGADIIVDINEAGSTIMTTNKLRISATQKTSIAGGTTQPGITDASIADDAEITIDFDQIGSTIAGKGLKVTIYYTR